MAYNLPVIWSVVANIDKCHQNDFRVSYWRHGKIYSHILKYRINSYNHIFIVLFLILYIRQIVSVLKIDASVEHYSSVLFNLTEEVRLKNSS